MGPPCDLSGSGGPRVAPRPRLIKNGQTVRLGSDRQVITGRDLYQRLVSRLRNRRYAVELEGQALCQRVVAQTGFEPVFGRGHVFASSLA